MKSIQDKMRFRVNGRWTPWQVADGLKIPDEVEAVEVNEFIPVEQLKRDFPNQYQKFKKIS